MALDPGVVAAVLGRPSFTIGPPPPEAPPLMRHMGHEDLDGLPADEIEQVDAYVSEWRPDIAARGRLAEPGSFEHLFAVDEMLTWWNMCVREHALAALWSLPDGERGEWRGEPVTVENQRRMAARAAELRRRPVPAPRPVARGASRGGRRKVRTRSRAKARVPNDGEGSDDPDLVGGAV